MTENYFYPNLVFSADSSLLAIHHQPGVFRVWDVRASEIGATLRTHQNSTEALRFLPDNRILAGCNGQYLSLWQWRTESMSRIVQHDLSEGLPLPGLPSLPVLRNLNAGCDILASSPDGQLIAALLWDQ